MLTSSAAVIDGSKAQSTTLIALLPLLLLLVLVVVAVAFMKVVTKGKSDNWQRRMSQ